MILGDWKRLDSRFHYLRLRVRNRRRYRNRLRLRDCNLRGRSEKPGQDQHQHRRGAKAGRNRCPPTARRSQCRCRPPARLRDIREYLKPCSLRRLRHLWQASPPPEVP